MTEQARNTLGRWELEVLISLPVEPDGCSLAELAEDLIGKRGPRERGQVKHAIARLGEVLGSLPHRRGWDGLGRPAILYGLTRQQLATAAERWDQRTRRRIPVVEGQT